MAKIAIATAKISKEECLELARIDEDDADDIAREAAEFDRTIAHLETELANIDTRIALKEAEYGARLSLLAVSKVRARGRSRTSLTTYSSTRTRSSQ